MTMLKIDSEAYITFPTQKKPSPDNALELNNIIYHLKDKTYVIHFDHPLEIMREIQRIFTILIKNNFTLPSTITPYLVGYQYNQLSHKYWNTENQQDAKKYDCTSFYRHSLFSINGIQTWIYNVENKIIMEITPSYKWDTIDPEEGEIIPTFDSFMQYYKPIAIHTIEKEIAQNWLDQANKYLAIVEPQFEEWSKQPGEHQKQLYRFKNDA